VGVGLKRLTPSNGRIAVKGSARTVILNVAIVIVILAAAAVGYYFYYQSNNYVTTDDAVVTATLAPVASPVPGVLASWSADAGSTVTKGQVLGRVVPAGPNATPVDLTAPIDGTVVHVAAVPGAVVAAGAPLGYVADLAHETVTAYVSETQIRNVKVGQSVDVYVDAFPNTTFSGTVASIDRVGASTFALIPTTDRSSGNFTKVTERIAVTIDLGHTADLGLAPGMNARVRIHI
jgi:multidrug resistance efflux pump